MAVKIVKGRVLPIGIDLGSNCLKLAQLSETDDSYDLIAAGAADIPLELQDNFNARIHFCEKAIRRLLRTNGFRGRQGVLSVPADATFVHHLKIPKRPPDQIHEAILAELAGKLPFQVADAEIRHVVAGDVISEGQPRQEVIVVAVPRATIQAQLGMAKRAKLDVAGINIESCAIVDCFARMFRRADDQNRPILFVDLGHASTQVVLSHGRRIVFARNITVAGRNFDGAIAETLGITPQEAHEIRRKLDDEDPSDPRVVELHSCMSNAIDQLVDELTQCLLYYEAVFRSQAIERLIFLGGQAMNKRLCQTIAQRLNLPAQIGDPLVRIGGGQKAGAGTGLDRREPQPRWAVAIGLSLGGPQAA